MKFLALLAFATLSTSAFSQTCYVDMVVKNTGRIVRTFTAYGDSSCIEGMKECRKSIRLDYSNNREYPNGSLDCISDRNSNPIPQPIPQPYPNPNPYPQPNPVPYRSVEARELILDIASVLINNSQAKTKIIEALINSINSYSMSPLIRLCSPTSSWMENANCLINGVQRAPREVIDESLAIHSVATACRMTSSWMDEKACFSIALRNNRLPSLSYLAPSCESMYNSQSASQCFRSLFGVN